MVQTWFEQMFFQWNMVSKIRLELFLMDLQLEKTNLKLF